MENAIAIGVVCGIPFGILAAALNRPWIILLTPITAAVLVALGV